MMTRQDVGRRRRLAEVVRQRGKADRQWKALTRGLVDHHQGMDAGIDLRMVVGPLRHAEQRIDLGQQPDQRAALAQHLEHARRPVFHQAFRQFLPDPLGNQMIDFAGGDHAAHQRQRFRRHRKIGEAGGKAGKAQDAHRVFGEGRADMAQDFGH